MKLSLRCRLAKLIVFGLRSYLVRNLTTSSLSDTTKSSINLGILHNYYFTLKLCATVKIPAGQSGPGWFCVGCVGLLFVRFGMWS